MRGKFDLPLLLSHLPDMSGYLLEAQVSGVARRSFICWATQTKMSRKELRKVDLVPFERKSVCSISCRIEIRILAGLLWPEKFHCSLWVVDWKNSNWASQNHNSEALVRKIKGMCLFGGRKKRSKYSTSQVTWLASAKVKRTNETQYIRVFDFEYKSGFVARQCGLFDAKWRGTGKWHDHWEPSFFLVIPLGFSDFASCLCLRSGYSRWTGRLETSIALFGPMFS